MLIRQSLFFSACISGDYLIFLGSRLHGSGNDMHDVRRSRMYDCVGTDPQEVALNNGQYSWLLDTFVLPYLSALRGLFCFFICSTMRVKVLLQIH